LDFSFGLKNLAALSAQRFQSSGERSAPVFRTIPWEIKGFDALGLRWSVKGLCDKPRGLVLVTGPTGSGKSTTLAAMLDKINSERGRAHDHHRGPHRISSHHKKCLVNQRKFTRTRIPSRTHFVPHSAKTPTRSHRRDARLGND